MRDAAVQLALTEMAQIDPHHAELAETVFERLTNEGDLDTLDLSGVQRFVWYELPVKWLGSADMRVRLVEAVAELFERLGLVRYAEVCRSLETLEVHRAYDISPDDGRAAFLDAYQRSGINAPDLDDFAWGDVMGPEETAALGAVERRLEEAMTAGRFVPGARGWKSAAREVTVAELDAADPELLGQTRRTVILTERLDAWLRSSEHRSEQLHLLRSGYAKRLLHPLPLPADAAERMAPVAWFLERAASGIGLTQAGYLTTTMVREGAALFEWDLGWTDRAPRSESELSQVFELHMLLRRLGAVRRRGKNLQLTQKGRRMRRDPEVAWRIVAAGLTKGNWEWAVAEVFALLLLSGEQRNKDLEKHATAVLSEYGWRVEEQPLDPISVTSGWWMTQRVLNVLGGVVENGNWSSRTTRLTIFGETTLLEQIRARATGPLSHMW